VPQQLGKNKDLIPVKKPFELTVPIAIRSGDVMKLFPSESFEIETTVDVAELVGRLSAQTRPAPLGMSDPPDMPLILHDTLLIGDVTNEGFELRRNIKFVNQSLARLFGAFHTSDAGTVINVNVCLTQIRRVSLSFISFVIPLAAFLEVFFDRQTGVFFAFSLMAFLGLLYAGTWYGVHVEASESRKILEGICRSPAYALR
jgi:hypothetical protein